jgi:hypothetical protein
MSLRRFGFPGPGDGRHIRRVTRVYASGGGPAGGFGELAVSTVAPAVANAVFTTHPRSHASAHLKNSPRVVAVDALPRDGMCHAASIVRSRL